MKRFQFPLERVRLFRQLQLEGEQAMLAQLHERIRMIDRQQTELRLAKEDAAQSVVPPSGSTQGEALAQLAGFGTYVERTAQLLIRRREETREAASARKEILLAARRKYELLNRLKERAQQKWQAGFDLEQEQLAGELYLARWKR